MEGTNGVGVILINALCFPSKMYVREKKELDVKVPK